MQGQGLITESVKDICPYDSVYVYMYSVHVAYVIP